MNKTNIKVRKEIREKKIKIKFKIDIIQWPIPFHSYIHFLVMNWISLDY